VPEVKAISQRFVIEYVLIAVAVCLGIALLTLHYRHTSPHATLIPPAYANVPVAATPLMQCETLGTGCRRALLQVINADRAQAGSSPLALDKAMTYGSGSCIGAAGHAKHMAEQGQLSHDQFPADVCSTSGAFSENVGAASTSDHWTPLLTLHQMMMAEDYTPGCLYDHHCSLVFSGFTHIGIGYHTAGGQIYLTETFSG
jgi:uncharacterized protein YkwD